MLVSQSIFHSFVDGNTEDIIDDTEFIINTTMSSRIFEHLNIFNITTIKSSITSIWISSLPILLYLYDFLSRHLHRELLSIRAIDQRESSRIAPNFIQSVRLATLPPIFLHIWRHRDLTASGVGSRFHQFGLAGFAVSHQHRYGDSSRRAAAAAGLNALARRPFRLVPVILEPNLHLRRREANDRCQVLSLGRAQITLLTETSL